MKIIFICGCLEPGKDGVGDYTRRLAEALCQKGILVGIVALNDKFVTQETITNPSTDASKVPQLRIPKKYKAHKRTELAKNWVEGKKPKWLSLQYVPYSFNDKGLSFQLTRQLQKIGGTRKWHIMFHELWIGREHRFDLKILAYQKFQKKGIKKLLAVTNPQCIHTHLPTYQKEIKQMGWQIRPLPLYSNISKNEVQRDEKRSNYFVIGFFSQIAEDISIIVFLKSLENIVDTLGIPLEIKLIGGKQEQNSKFRNDLIMKYGFSATISITGFLQPYEISQELNSCDIGITPVPRHGLGKSGSVAAFLTHGVPVAAPNVLNGHRDSEIGFFNQGLKSAIITKPDLNQLINSTAAAKLASHNISLSNIIKTFLTDLSFNQDEKNGYSNSY